MATNNGTTFFDAGATTTGAGLMLIQGSALTVTGAASIARLQQNTSTTTVNAPLTIGDYLFNAGTLTGTGPDDPHRPCPRSPAPSTKMISDHTVDNAGTVTWSQGGPVQLDQLGVQQPRRGGLFDITSDATVRLVRRPRPRSTTPARCGSPPGRARRPGAPAEQQRDARRSNRHVSGSPGVPTLANTGTIQVGTDASAALTLTARSRSPTRRPTP